MKRNILISSLLLLVALAATATNFTGRVIDEHGAPVAFANVVILNPDSAYISGSTTDADGLFAVECLNDCAIVKVSCLGYHTLYLPTTGDMGTIQLQPESTMLGEVTVTAARPTYKLTTEWSRRGQYIGRDSCSPPCAATW